MGNERAGRLGQFLVNAVAPGGESFGPDLYPKRKGELRGPEQPRHLEVDDGLAAGGGKQAGGANDALAAAQQHLHLGRPAAAAQLQQIAAQGHADQLVCRRAGDSSFFEPGRARSD